MMGFAAFLKSSFLLWYLLTIYETNDLFDVVFRMAAALPIPKDPKLLDNLGIHTERLIAAETTLLKELNKERRDQSQRRKAVDKHNRDVNYTLRLIDRDVLLSLQFKQTEVREIYRTLNDLSLYDYDMASHLDEFVKDFGC
jgi:hypothetical protein